MTMPKRLITIVGPNGVGKSTTAKALVQMRPKTAYVDSDWCRVINPFAFTESTKKTVTDNIFCLLRNDLLCDDIDCVIFTYGFHGERQSIFDEVIARLRRENILFDLHIVVLHCTYDENIRRATADGRDPERIERGMKTTFSFYETKPYPVIETTNLTPTQAARAVLRLSES